MLHNGIVLLASLALSIYFPLVYKSRFMFFTWAITFAISSTHLTLEWLPTVLGFYTDLGMHLKIMLQVSCFFGYITLYTMILDMLRVKKSSKRCGNEMRFEKETTLRENVDALIRKNKNYTNK